MKFKKLYILKNSFNFKMIEKYFKIINSLLIRKLTKNLIKKYLKVNSYFDD